MATEEGSSSIFLKAKANLSITGRGVAFVVKKALEKLDVEPQIIRHGKFKSAIEPLIAEKMSDENRAQMKALIDDALKGMCEYKDKLALWDLPKFCVSI